MPRGGVRAPPPSRLLVKPAAASATPASTVPANAAAAAVLKPPTPASFAVISPPLPLGPASPLPSDEESQRHKGRNADDSHSDDDDDSAEDDEKPDPVGPYIAALLLALLLLGYIFWRALSPELGAYSFQAPRGPPPHPRARLPLQQSFRFLLVGDSLTEGYFWSEDEKRIKHPYSTHLQTLLAQNHPSLRITIESIAFSGECVVQACKEKSIIDRLAERLEQGYFDLAIIMGGTNDIFHDVPAAEISAGLSTLHWMVWAQSPWAAAALSAASVEDAPASAIDAPTSNEGASSATGAAEPAAASASPSQLVTPPPFAVLPFISPKTLALTVPQYGDAEDESWRPPARQTKLPARVANAARIHVNAHLRSLCAGRSDQCTLVDLDVWFPRRGLSEEQRKALWAENVHPTPAGYDKLAEVIYQHLLPLLPPEAGAKSP